MDELIAFLRARLDEEAAAAVRLDDVDESLRPWEITWEQTGDWDSYAYIRIAKARVLAEVDAKRRIIDECAYWLAKINESAISERPYPNLPERGEVVLPVITLLGLPYADHPDYQDTWRP